MSPGKRHAPGAAGRRRRASNTTTTAPGARTRTRKGRLVVIGLKGLDRAAIESGGERLTDASPRGKAGRDLRRVRVRSTSARRRATSSSSAPRIPSSPALPPRKARCPSRSRRLRLANLLHAAASPLGRCLCRGHRRRRRSWWWCGCWAGGATGPMGWRDFRDLPRQRHSARACCPATTSPIRSFADFTTLADRDGASALALLHRRRDRECAAGSAATPRA